MNQRSSFGRGSSPWSLGGGPKPGLRSRSLVTCGVGVDEPGQNGPTSEVGRTLGDGAPGDVLDGLDEAVDDPDRDMIVRGSAGAVDECGVPEEHAVGSPHHGSVMAAA